MVQFIRALAEFLWLCVVRSAWGIGAIRGYAWLFKLDTAVPDWAAQHATITTALAVAWLFSPM